MVNDLLFFCCLYNNEYIYDRINTIKQNGFLYSFIYDGFGNQKQVKVGNQVLITNEYETGNGNLSSSTYGNNQKVSNEYDRFNRITKKTGSNGSYSYSYDAKSNLSKVVDGVNNETESYTYDLGERLVKLDNTNGYKAEYEYDKGSNINSIKNTLNTTSNVIKYNYDRDNKPTSIKVDEDKLLTYNYDRLARLENQQLNANGKTYKTAYTYKNTSETNRTTTVVESLKNGNNEELKYTYNKLGNIETISKGTTRLSKYYYDELSQLIREDNKELNKTIAYQYDAGGNMLSKKEYAYTEGTLPASPQKTITYAYGNTNWKDQLTSYDGKAITYDQIGNPLTYDGNTYTWQNGRQLAKTVKGTQTVTYKYNESGIRTEKTVNGVATKYYLNGSKVIYEKTGSNTIYYTYDGQGEILGLKYNNDQYYYIKNAQNDIIGLLDKDFNQVVSYTYDSWGKIVSIKNGQGQDVTNDQNNIGNINPYRYKGYRYDKETGLYYLQSRYYNPDWGRFLNGDSYGGTLGELGSHNIYAYCNNNPINRMDPDGKFDIISMALGLVVVAVLYTVTTIPQETWDNVGTSTTTSKSISTKTTTLVNTKTKTIKQQAPKYQVANLVGGKVVTSAIINKEQAAYMIKSFNQSVMCRDRMAAAELQPYFTYFKEDRRHGSGDPLSFYKHFHITSRHGEPHIWFYGE